MQTLESTDEAKPATRPRPRKLRNDLMPLPLRLPIAQ